jgi:cyclopropane-fatty-acyl-phospholipid synthase
MLLSLGIEALERGMVPDRLSRWAIRGLCRSGLNGRGLDKAFLTSLHEGPIAAYVEKANEQHYEVPAEFFLRVLGPRMKYSCCLFETPKTTLAEAEEAALATTAERAQLKDGLRVLDLGCGWGSFSLWAAERFPKSTFLAVSNSHGQKRHIDGVAERKGLSNLKVVTADVNAFDPQWTFDRVVSIEMFEHLRNYDLLFERIAGWLNPGGKLFVHHFCHRELAYPFETEGAANWMGRHFFTGGIMPSERLLAGFDRSLVETAHWKWNGTHYQRTADAWLERLDAQRDELLPILRTTYGAADGERWFHRWRVFFLAVAELFGYGGGGEWFVSHSLFERRPERNGLHA